MYCCLLSKLAAAPRRAARKHRARACTGSWLSGASQQLRLQKLQTTPLLTSCIANGSWPRHARMREQTPHGKAMSRKGPRQIEPKLGRGWEGICSKPGPQGSGVVEAAADELAALAVLALVGHRGALGRRVGRGAIVHPPADDVLVLVRVRADAAVAAAAALGLGLDADLRRGAQGVTTVPRSFCSGLRGWSRQPQFKECHTCGGQAPEEVGAKWPCMHVTGGLEVR